MEKKEPSAYDEALARIEACRQKQSTRLDLSQLSLSAVPAEIGRLKTLKELDLSNNQLATLPPEIDRLKALTQLYVYANHLAALPPDIGRLTALTRLYVFDNQLLELPPQIGWLGALTQLDVANNQLTTLPAEIGQLKSLTHFYLYKNRLTTLPPQIGGLAALTHFHVSSNQLSTLPMEIGQLTTLTSLDLSNNQLTALPAKIGQLRALTRLWLAGNELAALPAEIDQLTSLRELYLHDNPGLGLPAEVLGPYSDFVQKKERRPPREILAYYFRTRGAAGRALRECKIIVVGRGGVGKTTLVKRLSGEPLDPKEPETHGIIIRPLDFACRDGTVKARVWDFGGQVVLHSMHEFFLTARSLYVLVLGERDDMLERDAAYWLQLIRGYAGEAPVVVALNKSAGRKRSLDQATLERDYGPILGWVTTECSEPDEVNSGIARLREVLNYTLDSPHMDSVRRVFPAKWFAIKDWLEEMEQSYLDYPAYERKCSELGEPDAKEQAALAGDLHDLGIALNYGRDPRLRDMTVLRPDWLANGIYAVLRANDLRHPRPLAPGGVVHAGTMPAILSAAEKLGMLKAADYPLEKHAFLLRLMDAFHLSFPLDERGERQLVPALLPVEPPPGTDEPDSPDRQRLRYEFQVVPAPLMPKFIVRCFSLVRQSLHWQRGALLVFGEARARVWATQDERYLYATAAGPEVERKRLLAIIRGTLAELFGEYKNLRVVEQWEHNVAWVPRATLEEFGVLPRVHDQSSAGDEGADMGLEEEVRP